MDDEIRIRVPQVNSNPSQPLMRSSKGQSDKRVAEAQKRFSQMPKIHQLELATPEGVHAALNFPARTTVYKAGKLYAYLTQPFEYAGWHLAVGHSERYPSFDEMQYFIANLVPLEVQLVLFMPNPREYMGLEGDADVFCLHMGQIFADGSLSSQEPTL